MSFLGILLVAGILACGGCSFSSPQPAPSTAASEKPSTVEVADSPSASPAVVVQNDAVPEYASPDGLFTVRMPGPPKVKQLRVVTQYEFPMGPPVKSGGILVTLVSEATRKLPMDQRAVASVASQLDSLKAGKVTESRALKVQGHDAAEARAPSPFGDLYLRVIVTPKYEFAILLFTDPKAPADPRLPAMVESFHLNPAADAAPDTPSPSPSPKQPSGKDEPEDE